MLTRSVSCVVVTMFVVALHLASSCGRAPAVVAPTRLPASAPAGGRALTLHGRVHEANGGPLAKVFVGLPGTTSGGIAQTDESGAYQINVSLLPMSGSAAGALTFSQDGYGRSALLLTPAMVSTGDAGDVSLARVRHVSTNRPLSFSITDDDPRLGVSSLNESVCDPCVPIAIDDVPADGLRVHIEWDRTSALLTAFLEGTDGNDLPVQLGMTVPVEDSTDADITVPANATALSTTPPLLKVGFWTFVHTHVASPIAMLVSVVPSSSRARQ